MIRALAIMAAKSIFLEGLILWVAGTIGSLLNKTGTTNRLQVSRLIDAVYLWVDDKDPEWVTKRDLFKGDSSNSSASSQSRFRQFDELPVSIQLMAKNAPFVKRVFVVVDGQKPNLDSILPTVPFQIVVVNHDEFIPQRYLPTFNSRAITAHLHLIPDISEQFLYCNDDVFISAPSSLEDWFEEQRIKVRYTETRFPPLEALQENDSIYRARWKTNQLANQKGWEAPDVMPQHAPFPLTKSILRKVWLDFPQELELTCSTRFRSGDNILPELLSIYSARAAGLTVPAENVTYKYVAMNRATGIFPLVDLRLHPNKFLCVCLNDVAEPETMGELSEQAISTRYRRTLRFMLSSHLETLQQSNLL